MTWSPLKVLMTDLWDKFSAEVRNQNKASPLQEKMKMRWAILCYVLYQELYFARQKFDYLRSQKIVFQVWCYIELQFNVVWQQRKEENWKLDKKREKKMSSNFLWFKFLLSSYLKTKENLWDCDRITKALPFRFTQLAFS